MSRKFKSPEFYEKYPALFHNYYPAINTETVKQLSDAGFAFYRSVLNLDAIVDNGELQRIFTVLELQEYAIKKLSNVYPEEHNFWNVWNYRKKEYQEAVFLEKELFANFSEQRYIEVADKKSAFGKIAIDSLSELTENADKELYENLIESHKYFSLGFQIYDDIEDFNEDFKEKQFNIAVYELSKKIDFEKHTDVEMLRKLFYVTGLAFILLQKSIDSFEKAKSFLKDQESGWYKTIEEMQKAVSTYYETTFSYIQILKKKNGLKKAVQTRTFFDYSSIDNVVITKGLDFISKEFSENYVELQHFMWLSKKEGFDNETQLHYSDTFQRAMLNDCLLHISEKFGLKTDIFFKEENNYFLSRVNNDTIGTWSYFPTVQEVAADIDDLGQIMQQFIQTQENQLIDKYCLKAIDIATQDRTIKNGGIETWIIPKDNLTENQKVQDHFNSTKWGKGPDVEVVANFLYALFLYNAEKYSDTIKKGIDYIISQQKDDGFWDSRWYYGNYYGTYVVLRLLKSFPDEFEKEKQKSLDFIKNTQNEDGSFGSDEQKNLSTAFARLSLNYFPDEYLSLYFENSENFLLENQLGDGSWKAENFIKPKTNEPYKSKTLTTAFVLKSLL